MASVELRDFLESGKYKDGLNRCNKLLKKSPSDPRLLYFKASFLFGLSQNDEGNKILDQLCNSPNPITDLNLITSLDELGSTSQLDVYPRPLSNGPKVGKLWANATSAAGKNGVIAINRRRFLSAVTDRRWADAGTALIALKKADPASRSWKMAHIAVQQLLAEGEHDDKVAVMNRMLAFRTLKQMPVESSADLRFLIQLFGRQDNAKDILNQFETFKTQEESTVAKQALSDWQFTRKRIELSVSEARWEDLYALCSGLLHEDEADGTSNGKDDGLFRPQDDWTVWTGMIRACEKLDRLADVPMYNPEKPTSTKSKRLQMMAGVWVSLLLDQHAYNSTGENGGVAFERTIESGKLYFTAFQTFPFCFDDIKDFVVQIPLEAQTSLRKHIALGPQTFLKGDGKGDEVQSSEWLTAEVNALRFEYLLGQGIVENPHADIIHTFACSCIRLIDVCLRSKLSTADACYLAVSALIRLYELEKDSTYLFQAAYLLESGPALEDAHPAKVMLVYLETEIGLHAMAMRQYESLRVREIQHETMAHSLLTRISINHPFELAQRHEVNMDPFRMIDVALDMFVITDEKLSKSQGGLMERGQCDLVFELNDLRETLAHSMTRRLLILEQARIHRLTEDQDTIRNFEVRPRVLENWTHSLKDSRDYAETFNYDSVVPSRTPERRLQSEGKIPGSAWIKSAILSEDVWALLQGRETVCKTPISVETDFDEASASAELMTMEQALLGPWKALYRATQAMLSAPSTTSKAADLEPALASLTASLDSLPSPSSPTPAAAGLPPPNTQLQSHYLQLDLLKSASLLLSTSAQITARKRPGTPLPPDAARALADTVKRLVERVRASARAAKRAVDARDMVQTLRARATGELLAESAPLDRGLRAFAERAEGAALEAWEGVLKVRMVGALR
ncbi:hypothetical protein MBLNU459_g5754t1 [Dothideomycetes sp. NU459]